jgi:hypothetical protein
MTREVGIPPRATRLYSSAIFCSGLATLSTLLEPIMQAIGSLATLAKIVVASSHAQALGARRGIILSGWTTGAINPISRLTTTLDVTLPPFFVTMQQPSGAIAGT